MIKKKIQNMCLVLAILLLIPNLSIEAQSNLPENVSFVDVYSDAMGRKIKNTIILPDGYDSKQNYPVLYLLHGYGGNHDRWITKAKPAIVDDATTYNMIIVCPDGENSWYWDSLTDPSSQFETFVSNELVKYIDESYSTRTNKKGRAITGYSMGGHGALWLAIRHPDIFGACGSLSGGVDITPFPMKWEMAKQLGSYKENKDIWEAHTVINQLSKIEPGMLDIIFDCGKDDFFYKVNLKLHEELLYRNIDHHFFSHPGVHNNSAWGDAIDYHLVFFNKFFNKK